MGHVHKIWENCKTFSVYYNEWPQWFPVSWLFLRAKKNENQFKDNHIVTDLVIMLILTGIIQIFLLFINYDNHIIICFLWYRKKKTSAIKAMMKVMKIFYVWKRIKYLNFITKSLLDLLIVLMYSAELIFSAPLVN